MSDPYAQYKEDQPDKLEMLTALAEGWKHAMEDVERCAAELAKAQMRVREIEESEIPEIMDELEIETFTAKNGLKVEVKENVRCSIPKNKRGEAYAWLRENGHGALIKRKLMLQFGKGEEEIAEEFKKQLLELSEREVDDLEDVHNSTLVAFVKEKSEAGEELPTDLFPVFRQRVAKIK